MAFTVKVVSVDVTRRNKRTKLEITPTNANNYVIGGDVLDLTLTTNPKFLPAAFLTSPPSVDQVEFENDLAGAGVDWVVGTTLANGKLKVWASAGVEKGAVAYTAAELAAKLYVTITQNLAGK